MPYDDDGWGDWEYDTWAIYSGVGFKHIPSEPVVAQTSTLNHKAMEEVGSPIIWVSFQFWMFDAVWATVSDDSDEVQSSDIWHWRFVE